MVSGKAKLRVEGDVHEVGEGSVVSVDQGVDHQFVDVSDDLRVLVLFAPPDTPDDE